MTAHDTTVGVLYCGDLGSALGRLLRGAGLRVVTTCQHRSSSTKARALAAGIEILPCLEDVVAQSQVVFSLVLPAAALDVARQYANGYRQARGRRIFVEANSIGLETLRQIEQEMNETGVLLVDGSIHGGAGQLRDIGVLYLSGAGATRVSTICDKALRTECVDEHIGSATSMKLILSGFSKTMAAAFLEVGAVAVTSGRLDDFLEACRRFYPGVTQAVERMLPTYPRHSARRASEIREFVRMAQSSGSRYQVTEEAGRLLEVVADIDWGRAGSKTPIDVRDVVRRVAASSYDLTQERESEE